MTARDFCYWLQGCFELAEASKSPGKIYLDEAQTECVRKHLAMVFLHEIDPSFGDKAKQDALNMAHNVGKFKDAVMRC